MKHEGRVGATPQGVKAMVSAGQKVIIQSQAGQASGYQDSDYSQAGASIKDSLQQIYLADMVVKVKEPLVEEYGLLKDGGIIFTFLHLPANPKLVEVLLQKQMAGIAYEGVQLENGRRPILQEMSKIAGNRGVVEGFKYLKKEPKDSAVVVLGGAGVVGQAAIEKAKSLGANVIALDIAGKGFEISTPENISKKVKEADLLIGAVAIPGSGAPKLVSRQIVASMKPGSVIVDVAIDEGGCIETSRPTSHENPTFIEEGVIHYCVKNIPGAVPEISTPALAEATFPYILEIAEKGLEKTIKENPALTKGVHTYQGKITNQNLAETFNKEYTPLETLLK